MVGREVGDQLAHPRAELEREVRRRRADEGVDIADRGLGHRAQAYLLAELEGAFEGLQLGVLLLHERRSQLRAARVPEVRLPLRRHLLRYRCTAALRAFFTAAEQYCFAAAAGCSGAARPTDAGAATPASAQRPPPP